MTAVFMLGFSGNVVAGPLEDALARANSRRDYDSLQALRPFAEQGYANAEEMLGVMYELGGRDFPKDEKEALKWYRLAAEQGNAEAQSLLGVKYLTGHGAPQDYKEALKWSRLAAEQGRGDAQWHLGGMYFLGAGVPKDNVLGYMWHTLAAGTLSEPDVKGAIRDRDMFASGMSPAQIADAQAKARQCQASSYKQCEGGSSSQVATLAASPTTPSAAQTNNTVIPLERDGGTYLVPVLINGVITLKFTVDSGAADVSIPADVFLTLVRTGTIGDDDYLDRKTYVLADGSKVPSQTFRIRSLKIGDVVMENVTGSVASVKGELLLGQSFLSRLKSWSMDNQKHALIIESTQSVSLKRPSSAPPQ